MISFVCGQLCSGKTMYSEALAKTSNGLYIEVGDIVRSIKNTTDRKLLQDSKFLSDVIVEQLNEKVKVYNELVISGVRQKEILQQFPNSTLLWIDCPVNIRKERYENRARTGDNQSFEEAEQGDIQLGILEVKKYIFRQ